MAGIDPTDITNQGDGSMCSEIVVDVQETLRFFDEKPESGCKQATSIVSVIGEDLAAGCFQKHLESEGAKVCVRHKREGDCFFPEPVTTGGQKGSKRLDRWIVVDWPDDGRTVFQAEIKNSSAWAIGGEKIELNATPECFRAYKVRMWDKEWNPEIQSFKDHGTEKDGKAKVLRKMQVPCDLKEECIKPLFICWTPMAPKCNQNDFLFQVPSCLFQDPTRPSPPDCDFGELWVFSISSYLRSLKQEKIEKIALEMPIAAARLKILDCLLPPDSR